MASTLVTCAVASLLGAVLVAFLNFDKAPPSQPGAPEEVSLDALPLKHVAALRELYNHTPGRFLRGQHGATHFRLEPPKGDGKHISKIAVLSHGIGTDMDVFDGPITNQLRLDGFWVLRYDFYGHGWSHAANTFMHYDKDMFMTQLQELLDHILLPAQAVDLWVGHSTGGVVGALAPTSLSRQFHRLALVSPALGCEAADRADC